MEIVERIEKLRKELVELGMKKGFQDPQVFKKSQMLDELINQYYRFMHEGLDKKVAS